MYSQFSRRRMLKRTSRNRLPLLPLLVFLTEILFAVAGSEQCEVKDIPVTSDDGNSTFVYNFIYKDPTCSNKGELGMRLKSCDGLSDVYTYDAKSEGISNACIEEGRWKVTVGRVNSTCFNCTFGMYRRPVINLRLNYQELRIDINDVHPRVSSWNLTIYKTTRKWDYFTCNDHHMEKIKQLFQNTRLQPNISRTQIKMSHDFEEACYCILMEPISNMFLWPPFNMFTTSDCKPTPVISRNGVTSIDDLPMSFRMWVTLLVLVGIVILSVKVFNVILGRVQLLGRLPGLKPRTVRQRPSQEQLLSQGIDVLLLYAPDVSGSEHLVKLKKHLQDDFKVHDLFDRNDNKRLADPCGWVEEILMLSSGVKLLLVESVQLRDLIKSLLQPYPENPDTVKAAQTSCSLLTFALRTIICTNLREDYSTVFVVRFSDEVEDVADLVVQMRRYKFPAHFLKLKEAMIEARCSSEGKEVA